jgi:acetyl-CoA synthetase
VLGPVAGIGELNFVASLPKTRSGKIMRRVLKAVTLDAEPGDTSTIEDEGSVDEARRAWQEIRDQIRTGRSVPEKGAGGSRRPPPAGVSETQKL